MLNLWELFGLYFGAAGIAEVTLASFFIAAAVSILIIIYRLIRKIGDEYIPFGPFLVLGCFIIIFAGDGAVFRLFVSFCKMLSRKLVGGF